MTLKLISAGVVLALTLPTTAFAGSNQARAEVVNVEPIIETVTRTVPRQECRQETVAYRDDYQRSHRRSATGPILGAIIGGAIGNAVGHNKSNKRVGTAVGALLGGSIGADISRQHRGQRSTENVTYRTEDVCTTVRDYIEEERVNGYRVSYVYGGQTYTTRMDSQPGDTIGVRVQVTPSYR